MANKRSIMDKDVQALKRSRRVSIKQDLTLLVDYMTLNPSLVESADCYVPEDVYKRQGYYFFIDKIDRNLPTIIPFY